MRFLDVFRNLGHIERMQLTGIHHVTAVTARASVNHAFYTGTLGMRLVKKTVNQDDTYAYHLFYADGVGTPGTDLTFFDWPARRERHGTRSIVRTGMRVGSEKTLEWWREKFSEQGIAVGPVLEEDGKPAFAFEDPEGQRLALIVSEENEAKPWEKSPIPAEHQIQGLGPIVISIPELAPTDIVLTKALNMRQIRSYRRDPRQSSTVYVYEMGEGGSGAELHVQVEPNQPPASLGAGGVHHIAFRAPGISDLEKWSRQLEEFGIPSSGPIDRFYFQSLYFHDASRILFEIATDEPGFAVDEPVETLGENLSLPPFLEPRREEIESRLKPI